MAVLVELLLYLWLLHSARCSIQEGTLCRSNLSELVLQVSHQSHNWQRLQQCFYSSEQHFPSLVAVHYHYGEDNTTNSSSSTQVWLWASSPFYLYHSPAVLRYTSLFLSDASPNLQQLHLNLSHDCLNASLELVQLLTDRVTI